MGFIARLHENENLSQPATGETESMYYHGLPVLTRNKNNSNTLHGHNNLIA